MTSYLARFDLLPPKVCRLLARQNRRGLTSAEISKRSGLTLRRVALISKLDSWADVSIAQAEAFRVACGITPAAERFHIFYVLRYGRHGMVPRFHHLRSLGPRERARLRLLIGETNGDPFMAEALAALS